MAAVDPAAAAAAAAGWVDARTVSAGWWTPTTSGGWWGAADTDWCEPNYQRSHYIAEFWNALSSVPISTLGEHTHAIPTIMRFHERSELSAGGCSPRDVGLWFTQPVVAATSQRCTA